MNWRILIILVLLVVHASVWGAERAPAVKSAIESADGTYLIWHRTPADSMDLQMSLDLPGIVLNSDAYRVRDRKRRDIAFYASVRITTVLSPEEIIARYARELGPDVRRETLDATRETTLVAGTDRAYRLVVVAPMEGHCRVRLERVEHFEIPPRVYTEREQQVVRLVEQVQRQYAQARSVRYQVKHWVESPDAGEGTGVSPTLQWSVEYTRPAQLSMLVTLDEVTALQVKTRDNALIVSRQVQQEDETRPIEDGITLSLVPELRDDPVARMMLDDGVLGAQVDYLAILSMTTGDEGRRADVVLTYPENDNALYLTIDLDRQLVLRSVVEQRYDSQKVRHIREYAGMAIDPAATLVLPDHVQIRQALPTP